MLKVAWKCDKCNKKHSRKMKPGESIYSINDETCKCGGTAKARISGTISL